MENSQIKGISPDVDEKKRTIQHRRLWILLASIVAFFAAFWWLDICLAISSTESEKNITTLGIGMQEQLPNTMQRRETIKLAITGEGPLVTALQKALTVEINKIGIGDVELVEAVASKYQGPVMIVNVGRPGLLWMPFRVTSRLNIRAGYSSSGDNILLGESPVTVDDAAGPVITMYGEYKVNDSSWGLISRPGYYRLLANYLAQQIVATLRELYKVST